MVAAETPARGVGLLPGGVAHAHKQVLHTQVLFGVDLLGNMGFIVVMKYVPGLTVAVVLLLNPVLACAEGLMLGVDRLPGLLTYAGALVIVCSSAAIVVASQSQTTTVQLQMDT